MDLIKKVLHILIAVVVCSQVVIAVEVNVQRSVAIESLEQEQRYAWKDICEMYSDSVCRITSFLHKYNIEDPYLAPENGACCGSGFFISSDGKILTNYHVVNEAAVIVIQIPTKGKERFEVDYLGGNPTVDIALLQVVEKDRPRLLQYLGLKEFPFLPLGDSDKTLPGEKVMIMGYPFATEEVKMSEGVISGRAATHLGECIQTTAAANPGNSGGPFFNKQGEVIGILSMRIDSADGIGFCVPINRFKLICEELEVKKIVKNVIWGISGTRTSKYFLQYLNCPSQGGIYLTKVRKGYLAEKCGLLEGDVVISINNKELDYFGHISATWKKGTVNAFEFLSHFKCGETVVLKVCRDKNIIEIPVVIDADYEFGVEFFYPWHQESLPYEIIGGMVFVKLTKNHINIRRHYEQQYPWLDFSAVTKYEKDNKGFEPRVIITQIFPTSSLFESHCFLDGDSIVESVNGYPVKTIDDLREAILAGLGSDFFVVKCEQGSHTVLPMKEMLEQEEVLSMRYGYQKSPLVDILAQGLERAE